MRRILAPGRNCWTLAEADEAGVLVDARDYYRAFYRAALGARSYIALTGWQFDSDVALLRGGDAREARGEVRLLPFLQQLCEAKPELRVYILAWDYSMLLAFEREWMQHILFNWTTSERLVFRFDASSPLYGAHHQKVVLIDGRLAFTGGMDIADCRWDDREHEARSPLRCDVDREPHGPYHDVQTVLTGPVVRRLEELFEARWFRSGGGELHLPAPVYRDDVVVESTVPLPPGPLALSRTFGKTLVPLQEPVREIRALYLDAIDAAERFIYVENQYFSSRAIFDALVRRLRAPGRPKLEVAFVLPPQPEALREQLAMGVAQVRMLRALKAVARETGHSLGVYCSAVCGEDGADVCTYIHSKVMVVDDRFLTMGSANTTNRSLGLDSELNLSWECAGNPEGPALERAIRHLRVSLMVEHLGRGDRACRRALGRGTGLVAFLDRVASARQHRLRFHPLETVFDQRPLLKPLEPEELHIDPEDSVLEESLFETLKREGLFASGLRRLSEWLVGRAERAHEAIRPGAQDEDPPNANE
ncbi:phospholipase D-like domain-containing protein [Myxococcaceae bacterium GXIMD 01537]